MLQCCHAGQDAAKQEGFTGRPGIVAPMTVADLKAYWPAPLWKSVARQLQKAVHAMNVCAMCKSCSLPSIDGLHQWNLVLRFCSAVTLLVPLSMDTKAVKEECQLSFDGRPSFITLLDRIEQEPTKVKLGEVNYIVKAGKETVLESTWLRLIGARDAIKLAVSSVISMTLIFHAFLVCCDILFQSLLAPLVHAMFCSVALPFDSQASNSWPTATEKQGKASLARIQAISRLLSRAIL